MKTNKDTKKNKQDKQDKQTNIEYLAVEKLVPCNWNYKKPGTPEEIQKLAKSIEKDGSLGVLPVRKIEKGFEVIDGNHRYEAIKLLGWEKVPCENFGKISVAEAITIARRRNYKWFEDDYLKLAEVFNKHVFPEYAIEDLVEFMPDNEQTYKDMQDMMQFDWDEMTGEYKEQDKEEEEQEEKIKLSIELSPLTAEIWESWKAKTKDLTGKTSILYAFELALQKATEAVIREEKV